MKSIANRWYAFALLVLVFAVPAAGQGVFPAADWQVATPESQGMSSEVLGRVGQWLEDHGSRTGLVVRHGRIVGEWYFDGAAADTKLLVYSTTKSFSSTAAGLAIAAGTLKLDNKLGDFFPAATPVEKRDITVRQILSMTSGAKRDDGISQRIDVIRYALHELPMEFEPGTHWVYNNAGLFLLGPIIREATGRNVDELLDEEVFQKIGIPRGDWTWDEREGMPLPYSGLHITARSLARYGLLFLNKGTWNGRQIVPADWVAEATRPSQDLNPRYGYLWWNNTTAAWPGVPRDAYASLGRFDNDMLIVPSLDLIVIRQVGDDSAANHKLQIGELFALAVSAVPDAGTRAK